MWSSSQHSRSQSAARKNSQVLRKIELILAIGKRKDNPRKGTIAAAAWVVQILPPSEKAGISIESPRHSSSKTLAYKPKQ